MVTNQDLVRLTDGLFDSVKLMSDVKIRPPDLHHLDDRRGVGRPLGLVARRFQDGLMPVIFAKGLFYRPGGARNSQRVLP
jgi:hypothetical protein